MKRKQNFKKEVLKRNAGTGANRKKWDRFISAPNSKQADLIASCVGVAGFDVIIGAGLKLNNSS